MLEAEFAAIHAWEPHVHALVGWRGRSLTPTEATPDPGPLSGWSVGVKDIIDVVGSPTGCNAPFIPANPAPGDAAVVAQLRDLGAAIMAKTVTTTFAFYDPGPTRNPWDLGHTPGGSSSGSAVAVATGMVRLALGTQTIGSINRPASYCGVVGYKPSYGTLPVDGVFPLAPSVDTVGFFVRNVGDAEAALAALTGQPIVAAANHLSIGVVDDLLCTAPDEDMGRALTHCAQRLHAAGHDVRSLALPGHLRDAYATHRRLVAKEASLSHSDLYAEYATVYPGKLADLVEEGMLIDDDELDRVQHRRQRDHEELARLARSVDVLLSVAAPGPAPRGIEATGDPRMNLLWTYAGLPTVTLPAGFSAGGLPLGVQLTAAPNADATLLAAARVVEGLLGVAPLRPPLPNNPAL